MNLKRLSDGTDRRLVETELRDALHSGRFFLHAQDVIGLQGRRQVLYRELLLRAHPLDTAFVPQDLILAAEQRGVISVLDRWVLSRLLRYLREHPADGGAYAINLSGRSLSDPIFLEDLVHDVSNFGTRTRQLVFEITETAPIDDLLWTAHALRRLAALGCRFALDDFGAAGSSFAHLRELPLHFLKIDGGPVSNMLSDPRDFQLVKALNSLGHDLGLMTIAEHVQEPAQLAALKSLGVDAAQGYALADPRPLL
jgi:EAL domain-containing protein (putative c-di-GMP-specific phosphodiesterase class I)